MEEHHNENKKNTARYCSYLFSVFATVMRNGREVSPRP